MCGLVGIAGKLDYKDEMTMKRLLMNDYWRGPDSTGFVSLKSSDKTAKIAKIASHPLDLFEMKRFTDALNGFGSSVFMGHNRLATKGKINNHNAHPYQYDHIIGAHNGTLEPASWKELEGMNGETTDVDSQALIMSIARNGIEDTIKAIRGAWALTWIDLNANTLNFLRNKERPFWYAYTKTFDRLFWASEYWMIERAVAMSNQPYDMYKEEKTGYGYWSTEENWWYRFDLDALKKGAEKRPKARVTEIKGKEPAPVNSNTGHTPFRHWPHQTPHKTTSTTTSRGTSSTNTGSQNSSEKDQNDSKVIMFVGSDREPLAGVVTKDKFAEYSKYGCGWCGQDVDFYDPGVTVFKDLETVMCSECSGGEANSRVYVPATGSFIK